MSHLLKFFFVLLAFSFCGKASAAALDKRSEKLIEHVKSCLEKAEKGNSKLPQEILQLLGMSGKKTRHFLNNLCSLPGTRYLEVGCWKGSTFVSALYGNKESVKEAFGIDNWSEFDGPYQEFCSTCSRFIKDVPYQFFSMDAFSFPKHDVFKAPINIYFYDGNHSALSQELALTFYDDILDDQFILVVDDWNWEEVRFGTFKAFEKLSYKIVFQKEIFAPDYNCDLERWQNGTCNFENWWNGLLIAVISKRG